LIKAITEGVTLNKAHFLLLIEPNPHYSKQRQFIYHVYQISQLNPVVKAHILCNPDSRIEKNILNKHTFKAAASSKIHKVDTDRQKELDK